MIEYAEQKVIIETKKPKKDSDRQRPVVIPWKDARMVRAHSFLAMVREIIQWSTRSDVTKVSIIGKPDSGKSTLSQAIAHVVHKYADMPFAVRVFSKEHMMNFKETLSTLTPSNYILVFDDISFLGADANKKQVDMIKQAETTIRHLPGGQDVKIILIYNYHYTLGLDKYLRQADFYIFTTVGSEETDNVTGIVGKKYDLLVNNFKRYYVSAKARDYWMMRIGPKEPFLYRYRNPFIPVLFFNNESLRFVVSPKRQWIDKYCGICDSGMNASNVQVGRKPLPELLDAASRKFQPSNLKRAVEALLFVHGLTVYSAKISNAIKYIDMILKTTPYTMENIAAHYGYDVKAHRLRLAKDDPLKQLMEEEKKDAQHS